MTASEKDQDVTRHLTRRRFLALSAAGASAAVLAACGGTAEATPTTAAPAVAATAERPPTQAPIARGTDAAPTTAPAASAASSAPAVSPTSAPVAATASPTIQAVAMGKAGGTKIYRVGVASEITELDPPRSTTQVNMGAQEALYNYAGRYTYNPRSVPRSFLNSRNHGKCRMAQDIHLPSAQGDEISRCLRRSDCRGPEMELGAGERPENRCLSREPIGPVRRFRCSTRTRSRCRSIIPIRLSSMPRSRTAAR